MVSELILLIGPDLQGYPFLAVFVSCIILLFLINFSFGIIHDLLRGVGRY